MCTLLDPRSINSISLVNKSHPYPFSLQDVRKLALWPFKALTSPVHLEPFGPIFGIGGDVSPHV